MSKHARIAGLLAVGLALTLTAAPLPAVASTPAQPAPAAHAATSGELRASLDAVVAAGAPGAFAEVRAGNQRWSAASGVADVRTQRPMKPWLRHRVASLTKPFVATAVLQLAEEGRLGLDEPIERWLPDLVGEAADDQITVRMLLNHTSGLAEYSPWLLSPDGEEITLDDILRVGSTSYDPHDLVEIGLSQPRTNEPGARHSYSNTNYVLLGLIIERVTGRDAAGEISRRIIRPLGLRDTYFPGDQRMIRGPHAAGYLPGVEQDFRAFQMSWLWMAGDLVSTTGDLNRFFRALLGGDLLGPEMLAQMRTTVPVNPAVPEVRYGLGILQTQTGCGEAWGHDGVAIGYVTYSLHTADGARQMSFGTNLSHFWTPGEVHPIEVAMGQLVNSSLCPHLRVSSLSAVPPAPMVDRPAPGRGAFPGTQGG